MTSKPAEEPVVAATLTVEVDMVVEDAVPAVEVNQVRDYSSAHQNTLMVTHDSHPATTTYTLAALAKISV